VHTNPFDEAALREALGARTFDVCVATYGRLRVTAKVMAGRCGRFVSVGGAPAYSGYMNADAWTPAGMPVPTREDARTVPGESEDAKGFRIRRTEEAVLAIHPTAAHFRYPYVYGKYQLLPREWLVVRRILDRRPFIVVPDDGLTLCHYGYAQNLAHALLLAIDKPEASAGEIYNCGDEEILTLRQVIELVTAACGAQLELVSMPWELAVCARPLVMQQRTTHRVLDLTKLRVQLGYRDVVPAREALAATARELLANPLERGGKEEKSLTDPFDYAAEDDLVGSWRRALASVPPPKFAREPGFTLSYSGPGGTARKGAFEE